MTNLLLTKTWMTTITLLLLSGPAAATSWDTQGGTWQNLTPPGTGQPGCTGNGCIGGGAGYGLHVGADEKSG